MNPPVVFGFAHIIYAIISVVLIVVAIVLIKKFCLSKRSQDIAIYISASVLLGLIIFNRISIAVVAEDIVHLLPESYCAMTSLLLAIAVLAVSNRNHPVFHFLVYMAFVGGFLTTAYPDFISQADSIWHSRTISGLLHHSVSLYLAILLVVLGRFKPTIKLWYAMVFGFAVYKMVGLFFYQALGIETAMNIFVPLMPWLYWWTLSLMFIVVYGVGLGLYEYLRYRYTKKTEK